MTTVRLTAAQAAVTYLSRQFVETEPGPVAYFAGVWAIFGHGNVAGLGEALHSAGAVLPTFRAHNEQGMAHAAIAFAKQSRRRRAMICTTSIGPGATNLVSAAALAHVNRLPVLFLPGDVHASRRPDPVLQQIEHFGDGTISANDCLKPVCRYFDRITRPEQLLDALPRTMAILLDPAACGPVALALCQDVQTEPCDFPQEFFQPRIWRIRASRPDPRELADAIMLLKSAQAPLIVAGGGVLYAGAEAALASFALESGIPVAETQGGKGALSWDHPRNLGGIGVTGSSAANAAARAADLIVGIGTRLQDFTTGSRALFAPDSKRVQINVAAYDVHKHGAFSVVGDAGAVIEALRLELGGWRTPAAWTERASAGAAEWNTLCDSAMAPAPQVLPSDAQVIGAVWRAASPDAVVVCAAGGLPGELHKLWRTRSPGGYHVEYGYSCMGYEIAGGLGAKLAVSDREVHVLVGDGSYLMMNSEIATSVMLGQKLIITVLDNKGYGCINRLQVGLGCAPFNNLLADTRHRELPRIDFAAHAASLGAVAENVAGLPQLEAALERARASDRTHVVVIETDPMSTTAA
ncbi:MAG TPA: 3D-(3,5/4)-trihydroxycyclohexane-1,2-dione acylhydrolase (decyclizing), partial [Steroidobacteraceae bacterium]|nr:3D-(3,5/4)-trihydroxycyclohexane-1,2-dione acylhydrolase (decyclizing) [Steroidobacteraceae bacterium]